MLYQKVYQRRRSAYRKIKISATLKAFTTRAFGVYDLWFVV